MKYSIAALLVLLTLSAGAQNTFIKRYKNTTIAESGVAVCLLPNNQYAIVGQQANGFAWQAPMVVITDSAGNQIRHWVDTTYNGIVYDAVSDSSGNIYIAGNFYGYATVAKYSMLGIQLWERSYSANEHESNCNSIAIVNDTMIVMAGGQYLGGGAGSNPLVAAYNLNGDAIWVFASPFEVNLLRNEFDVLSITHLDSVLYLTGAVSDTSPQQPFLATLSLNGSILSYSKIPENGLGFAVQALSSDSIFIAGCGVDSSLRTFNALYLVNADGQVLSQQIDSSVWNIYISKTDIDRQRGILYVLTFDTINENGGVGNQDKILAYQIPVTSLDEPLWQKTISGTRSTGSFRDLKFAGDGTVLHTATATENCPNCPYLAKIDKDACTDMACDTGFITGIVAPTLVNVTFKLYPNPLSSGPLYYELQSDEPIHTIEATCYDLSGKAIPLAHTENYNAGTTYKAALHINSGIANGMYIVKWLVNGRHSLYARFVKAG